MIIPYNKMDIKNMGITNEELPLEKNSKPDTQLEREYHIRRASISHQAQMSLNVFGRSSPLQFKKRIGVGNTKVQLHRRTMTEGQAIAKKEEKESPRQKLPGVGNELYGGNEDNKEKVQIIEALEAPEEEEEEKVEKNSNDMQMEDKIKKQIRQAEELITKFTQDRIEVDDFNSEGSNMLSPNDQSMGNDNSEKEIDVTVGDIQNSIAILVTKECYLIGWPLDMLPKDVRKGNKFSILVKRNENSEVLRENAIWTAQNQIFAQLSVEK